VVSDADSYYPGPGAGAHPGPASTSLPASIRDAILEHARREVPNEACGLIVGDRAAADGGRALRWEPLRNPLASPYRYAIDPDDLLRLTVETDDADEVFWAIVHSHITSPSRIRQARTLGSPVLASVSSALSETRTYSASG